MTDTYTIETSMPPVSPPSHPGDGARLVVAEWQRPISPVEPGQMWVVEHLSAEPHLSPLARHAVTAANVVIYDPALYPIVAANLPFGGYAEPGSFPDGSPAKTLDRCIQFARDGWSVVWLADHRTRREERIGQLVDRVIRAGCPAFTPVTLFLSAGVGMLRQTETELCRLGILVEGATREGPLAIAFAAVGAGTAPHLHAISSNGLAG
jgi:hypothetical protein